MIPKLKSTPESWKKSGNNVTLKILSQIRQYEKETNYIESASREMQIGSQQS